MTKSNKQFLAVLGIVLGITGVIVGFVLWDNGRTSERLSAESDAIGFVATPTEWYDSIEEEHMSGHTLTFSYLDANSKAYTRTMEQVTWYKPGTDYKVCYNPADPEDWKLYPATHECGS